MSAPDPGGKVLRTMVGTTVGSFGLALSITLLYLNMRAVMSIGGSCATGGPYVIAQPCPQGTGWMMMVGILGWFGFSLLMLLTVGKGPQLWVLAWSALFLALGWNFIDFHFNPPETTTTGGWLACGIVFWLMGGLPLLGILRWGSKATFWGLDDGGDGRVRGPDGTPIGGPGGVSIREVLGDRKTLASAAKALGPLLSQASVQTRADPSTPPWVTTPADHPSVAPTVVDGLERLAHLHTEGSLTDTEYETAKRTLLGDG
jgi:hypothetical protein